MDGMDRVREELEKMVTKARWQGYAYGKAQGALAILEQLDVPRSDWTGLLADSFSLSREEARNFIDEYVTNRDRHD